MQVLTTKLGAGCLLSDPSVAWLVRRGAVDLFLVRAESGQSRGARFPVIRMVGAEVVIGPGTSPGGYTLLAQPAPGAQFTAIPTQSLSTDQIRDWVATLASVAGLTVPSLQADRPGSLTAFHQQALQALIRQAQEQESRIHARLQGRFKSDRATAQGSRRALAAVLESGLEAVPTLIATSDPLVACASKVAQRIGVSVIAPSSGRRSTERDPMESIARASSVRIRRVRLEEHWYRKDSGAFVGYLAATQQPVALLPKGPSRYQLWDPVTLASVSVNEEVAARLSTHAHTFYRSFPAERLDSTKLIAFGVRGLERDIARILMAGVLAGLLGLIPPIASGTLFDSIIPGADRGQLLEVFLVLLAAAISTWLLGLVQGFALLRVEGRMDAGLQAALWDRLMSLPATFFRRYNAGDLAVRSLAISSMRQVLAGAALSTVLTGVFSAFSLALLFYYGKGFALPAAGLVLASFLVTAVAAFFQVRIQREFSELSGRVAGLLPQLLGGISKLRVAGAEERAFARWAIRFAEQKRLAVRSRRISASLIVFFPLFQALTMMALFSFLVRPSGPSLSTGAFLAFQAAFLQVLSGASQIGQTLISVLGVVPLYERARPILETLPEVSVSRADPGTLAGEIEFSHVAFRYRPGLPAVLKDVSFRIRAGQFVAFIGGTGSGKSTLFRLMLGFESPESGSLFLDGQDLALLDVQAVRRQIGVVLQQGSVLGGDLFSNITGSLPLTVDDAWEAARMAGLEEDIRNMPMGMFTVIPDGGLGLSGGQRQRLQIARAIVNRPRLILFDEATSALDNQTQAVVTESLSRLKSTRIVIAHRLSTILEADCIFVLNNGVIEESGTYADLIARNGVFATLAKRQLA